MLSIRWNLGLANNPHIVLEDKLDLTPREESEFQYKDRLWWHIQENGLVRYFSHTGREQNEGGYGGANFDILYQGKPKTIRGPWSSRASYLNQFLPPEQQVADITLYNGKSYPIHIGILVSKLQELWNLEAYLLRAKAKQEDGEPGPITASLAANCILKPDNMRYDPAYDYEIFAEPIK